ncbi:unnamed protein product [Medioppia subpectinata]|uniref:Uncharacterized protein n=1 Tax=Medioppia subpectinata TaxID=1979941 RepID=A0A7R9PYH5_9ACAR|nr:unnamed protein product [Medioppia subpectinata]CAG2105078.1 unnamed protein product [Medioppia subpectinata]
MACWVWSLFIRAHKKDLEFSDLYRCPKSDETHRVRNKLEIKWDKQLKSKGKPSLFWALFASYGPELIVLYIPDAIRDKNTNQEWAIWAAVGIMLAALINMFITHVNGTLNIKVGVRIRAACCALIYRKAAIVLYLLWPYLRWACLAGMGILVLFIPFQVLMGRMFRSIRQKTAELTDSRIRLMQEIIAGMRVIKMYAWEQPFAQLVATARKSEVKHIRSSNFLKGINLSVFFVILRLIVYACFVTYILMGGVLSAETAFATIAYFNAMRWSMAKFVPLAIAALSELIVVIKRIESECKTRTTVGCRWISWQWKDIASVGSSGSEGSGVVRAAGVVGFHSESSTEYLVVRGRVSYAPQESWAFIASVRQNILFGSQYNEEKYNRVVKACALDRDFKLFPYGDQTLVGERGVSLSGGQKARISLARALYHSADIYLLDDPLSAVDTHVAKHLFQKCCVEYLKDKTRVLVTHQIQFLRDAHQILVLNDGECVAIGSYNELKKRGIDLMAYQRQTDGTNDRRDIKRRTSFTPSMVSSLSEGSEVTDVREPIEVDEQEVKAELKMIGSVESTVYMDYIKAGAGPLLIALTVLFIIISQVLYQGSDYWLSLWTNQMSQTPKEVDQTFNIIIYTSLISGLFVSALLSTICFYIMCMRSSVNLYNRIFCALLRSPIHLFESSPIARSPVYSHVNTTLCGLTSIRAFGAQHMFERQFEVHQNDNTSTFFLFICTSRALGVLMDTICLVYVSAVIAYIMTNSDSIPGGNAGLLLTSALPLTNLIQYCVKQSADTESYMTAVERVLEYTAIKPEAELESTPDRKPPKDWPQMGKIVFKDMSLQYNESPHKVLKDINVCLKGGEKVGVVGRTGAGKSSIIAALFRLTEPLG